MRWFWRGLPLVHAVLLASACGVTDTNEPTPVESVAVTPPSMQLTPGTTGALDAEVKDATGNVVRDRRVVWATANPGIATVSDNGVVTGVAAGRVDIAATAEGKAAIASVTVVNVPVARVTVTPADVPVIVGKSAQLSAHVLDAFGNALPGRAVAWQSSDTRLATVDQNGLVRAIRRGTAIVSASSEGKAGTATIRIP